MFKNKDIFIEKIDKIIEKFPVLEIFEEKYYLIIRIYNKIERKIIDIYQIITKGYADSDTWSLDYSIAKYTLPRLKRLKEVSCCHPMNFTEKEWNDILDIMIYSMESIIIDIEMKDDYEDIVWEDVETGLELFGKYFRHLWW